MIVKLKRSRYDVWSTLHCSTFGTKPDQVWTLQLRNTETYWKIATIFFQCEQISNKVESWRQNVCHKKWIELSIYWIDVKVTTCTSMWCSFCVLWKKNLNLYRSWETRICQREEWNIFSSWGFWVFTVIFTAALFVTIFMWNIQIIGFTYQTISCYIGHIYICMWLL